MFLQKGGAYHLPLMVFSQVVIGEDPDFLVNPKPWLTLLFFLNLAGNVAQRLRKADSTAK